jgi:MoxR-like ATPase
VRSVLSAADLRELRQQVRQQRVEANLLQYIAQLVGQTRAHKALYLGVSPCARWPAQQRQPPAAPGGRDFVTPED